MPSDVKTIPRPPHRCTHTPRTHTQFRALPTSHVIPPPPSCRPLPGVSLNTRQDLRPIDPHHWQSVADGPPLLNAKLRRARKALHTTKFLGLSAEFPPPLLAACAKFPAAKFTTEKLTRHQIPLPPSFVYQFLLTTSASLSLSVFAWAACSEGPRCAALRAHWHVVPGNSLMTTRTT